VALAWRGQARELTGDDFTRLGLPDPMHGTLADQESTGQYLSGDDARQTAARLLAHDQEGWLT
jgi:hypothetical protein